MDETHPFDRYKPSQLIYVELDAGNGGMLLSASEEGFSFRAVTPLRPSGPVAFAFLLDGKTRLEGKGKMIWSEEEGRRGGILFTEVTPQFRREFESWLRRKESRSGSQESRKEPAPSPPAPEAEQKSPEAPRKAPQSQAIPPEDSAPQVSRASAAKILEPPPAPQRPAPEKVAAMPPTQPKEPAKGKRHDASKTGEYPNLDDLERALRKASFRPAVEIPRKQDSPPAAAAEPGVVEREKKKSGVPPAVTPAKGGTETADEVSEPAEKLPGVPKVPERKPELSAPAPPPRAETPIPPAEPGSPAVPQPTSSAAPPAAKVPEKESAKALGSTPETESADTMQRVSRRFRLEFVGEKGATEIVLPPEKDRPAPAKGGVAPELPRIALNSEASAAATESEPAAKEPETPAAGIGDATAAGRETSSPEKSEAEMAPESAEAESATTEIPPQVETEGSSGVAGAGQTAEEIEATPGEKSAQEDSGVSRGERWGRAAAIAFVCVCIVWAVGLLAVGFRKPIGEEMIRLGHRIAGEEVSAEKSAPAQGPERTSAQTRAAPKAVPNNAPASTAANPEKQQNAQPQQTTGQNGTAGSGDESKSGASNSGANDSGTNPPGKNASGEAKPSAGGEATPTVGKAISATGQKEFEEARKILHGNHRSRDMEKAVELLLTSVSRGNVRAEVTLGDMYARGDGVPQDCGQARILFEAAVKKGSPEARRLLGKLKSEGCP